MGHGKDGQCIVHDATGCQPRGEPVVTQLLRSFVHRFVATRRTAREMRYPVSIIQGVLGWLRGVGMWRAVSKGKAGPRISDWRVPGEWDRGGSQLAIWRMSLAIHREYTSI